MTLLRQVIDEHCERKGCESKADMLEKEVRYAREQWPHLPLDNNTVRTLLTEFFQRCNKRPEP